MVAYLQSLTLRDFVYVRSHHRACVIISQSHASSLLVTSQTDDRNLGHWTMSKLICA